MATAQTVINDALTTIGVLFPQQTPSASMSADVLTRLNNMLYSWTLERLIVYSIQATLYPLVANQNAYTLGAGGTLGGSRPNSIVRANVVIPASTYAYTDLVINAGNAAIVSSAGRPFVSTDAGSSLLFTSGTGFTTGLYVIVSVDGSGNATLNGPVGTVASTGGHATLNQDALRFKLRLVTVDEWADITEQSVLGTVPKVLYDDYEYPASNLLLYPTPKTATAQLELFTWQPLNQFATLGTTFDMPPGYQQAVTYNLAQILAPVYGRPMPQDAAQTAMDSLNRIRGINAPPTHLSGAAEEGQAAATVAQQVAQTPPNSLVGPVQR